MTSAKFSIFNGRVKSVIFHRKKHIFRNQSTTTTKRLQRSPILVRPVEVRSCTLHGCKPLLLHVIYINWHRRPEGRGRIRRKTVTSRNVYASFSNCTGEYKQCFIHSVMHELKKLHSCNTFSKWWKYVYQYIWFKLRSSTDVIRQCGSRRSRPCLQSGSVF